MIKKQDKKGFVFSVASALFFVILIGSLIGIVYFISSDKFKWIVIGGGIIFAGVYLFGKVLRSNKVTGKKILPVLIILLIGIGFIVFSGQLETQFFQEGEDISDICSTEEECINFLKSEGAPQEYLDNIRINCNDEGECEIKVLKDAIEESQGGFNDE
ncbi:MAG: hypothetical protein ACOCV1_01685 [Bacillota bacterium]